MAFQIVKLLDPIQVTSVSGGLVPKGAYNNATAYVVGDSVSLSGTSYICISVTTGNTPPNTTYWQVLASKGNTGSTGATGSAGPGVSAGGTSGQALVKNSNTDYDTGWVTIPALIDGDKGDITVTGSGTTWTIDANVITNAKAAQMAANTIKGNNTGSTANASDLTVSQLKTLLAISSSDVSGLGALATQSTVNLSTQATGTLQAGQEPAHTGDVTNSAGSLALTIANSAVTLAKMADVSTSTVFYRKTSGTGAPETQTLATLKTDLGLTGTNTGDQTITLTSDVTGSGTGSFATTIANDAVTNAKLANMAASTFKGRITASTGDPEDLTGTQATTLLDLFTSSLKGLVPLSGGGTTNFLRADGNWSAPPGGGGGTVPTGTGFRHVTSGTEDAASKLVDTADINNSQVTLAKMADMATSSLIYRKTAGTGVPEVNTMATLKTDLGLTGTNSGDQTITLSGDISGSGTGAITTTIGANKVTIAMMATIATDSILGRATAGTGNLEVLTALPFAYTGDVTRPIDSNVTTIATSAVTLAKMADVATSTVFYRKTSGTGVPEVNTLATLKTDLGLTGTNSGDQTITLTGDVTGSGTGSFAATVTNGAITYAKIQNITASKLLGRDSSGGTVQEISLGTNLSLTGTTLNATAGGSTVSGQANVNFGAITQEDYYATVTVTTASALTASVITVTPSGVATADHDPDDYQWDNITGYAANIVNGTSFDIIGVAPNGTYGLFRFNYTIN